MTKPTKPRARSTQSTMWLVVLLLLLAFYFFYTRQAPQPASTPPGATPTLTTASPAAVAAAVQPPAVAPEAATADAQAGVSSAPATVQPQAVPRGARATATRAPPALIDGLPTISAADLPPEALDTLALIESNGPFPFSRDGVVFQNRERLLPRQSSGYYHEYTVITPGSDDRGARRIIAGEAGERYYTDDHYDSFFVIVDIP